MKNILLVFFLLNMGLNVAAQQGPKAGDVVTAKDNYNLWLPATILEVGAGKYKVHYNGYSDNWDAWVPADWIRTAGKTKSNAPKATAVTNNAAAPPMTGNLPTIPGSAWKIIMYDDGRPVSVYLFCPNGRYQTVPSSRGSVVFMGTYKVQGNRLITKAEDGAVTTYTMSWKNGYLFLNDGKAVLKLLYNGVRSGGC